MIGDAKQIRSLFVVPSLKRAGAETQVVNLVGKLNHSQFEPRVFSFEEDLDQLNSLRNAGVPHHHHLRKGKYDLDYIKELARLIDKYDIDVIHCSLQFSLLVAWLARCYSRRKPPLVAAIHTTVNRGLKEEIQDRVIYRWLLRRCSRIIFVCEAQRRYWHNRYPELCSRSCTIYNGVDHEFYSRNDEIEEAASSIRVGLGISPNDIVITAVAGFRSEKRHDLLVDAFEKLPDSVHMIFAGDGPTRAEIEGRIHALGLGSRVHFLGTVDDIRPVLAASTATVLASTAVETFSMAVLESMAMEVPTIVPNLSGLPEAVENGVTGFVYPTGNVDALANALLNVTKLSTMERKKMGAAARQRLLNNFTEAQMVNKTELILKEVASTQNMP